MEASGTKPVFLAKLSRRKFSKPLHGALHAVRFIRSDGILDVFGERFPLPEEAVYEDVMATIDVTRERMVLDMGGTKIGEMSDEAGTHKNRNRSQRKRAKTTESHRWTQVFSSGGQGFLTE